VKSNRTANRTGKQPISLSGKVDAPAQPSAAGPPATVSRTQVALFAAAVLLLIGWAYWPTFLDISRKWSSDPQYSHGYLVPLFSIFLLWRNRGIGESTELRPSWWGLPLLLSGLALYLAGAYLFFDWFQAISLLPVLAGAVLLIGGWQSLRRAAWPIAFLAFMFPLPFRIETALSHPLQRIWTIVSTYTLQTVGLPAISEGNVIIINEAKIGVVEACNGLGMMLLFFAIATAVAILVERPMWQKIVLVLSAVPIAVIANVSRIAVTGLISGTVGQEWVDWVFHDLAGWFMMPLALALLGLELMFLSRLFVDVETRTTRLQIGGISSTPTASEMKRRPAPTNGVPSQIGSLAGDRSALPAATTDGSRGE